jgi:hypothetical protein
MDLKNLTSVIPQNNTVKAAPNQIFEEQQARAPSDELMRIKDESVAPKQE